MLFSSSAQRWEILKKHVELSIKSQSDTRWESRIKCIKPLRYNLKEVLLALKDLEAISIERKDGRAVFITFSCFSVSLLSFRSVCINVLLNSGIGAEFFMTCTFGIDMLYSDISLFTYVQIVVYFLNAAFQFYTSKVI